MRNFAIIEFREVHDFHILLRPFSNCYSEENSQKLFMHVC